MIRRAATDSQSCSRQRAERRTAAAPTSRPQQRNADVDAPSSVVAFALSPGTDGPPGGERALRPPTPPGNTGRGFECAEVTPQRIQRRLDELGRAAQEAGQFGPAVRAEELLGKSIGMWIDQSLRLSGVVNDSHVAALLELARKRQTEPVDLADKETDT